MIIGMDFGTTNSGMAAYDGTALHVLPLDPSSSNPQVARTALYITNQKQIYMGRAAIDKYYEQNLNRKVKFEAVWVGEVVMTYAELPEFVRDVYIDKDVLSPGRLFLSFKTSLPASHYAGTTIGSDFYFIEDITAVYLYITRRRAERLLGHPITTIVLGRPVHFSLDPQLDRLAQQRLLHAAFRAGYQEVYFQYEPIAAAYFYETTITEPQNVLVFDFGGGTLDISIMRLGDPAHRDILATGGIPIAGDVFDQKLARARLPVHFGEGTTYRDDGVRRPVPSHFFEAFSHWQNILELNTPRNLEILEQIARTASDRRLIKALIGLVSSNYGLKLFDEAEATKRELSRAHQALLRLEGPGFSVREFVTRLDFERLIRQEREAIEALLDDTVQQAGLRPDQIDAVIRTGGSSEIPVFIEMLQSRFGADKVRRINTFSSVTSGLGVIAHEIESGRLAVTAYRARDWSYGSHVQVNDQKKGVPVVDLDIVKKFIDLQENVPDDDQPLLGLVTLAGDHRLHTTLIEQAQFGTEEVRWQGPETSARLLVAPADDPLLLITSDYRFLLKTARNLHDIAAMGLSLMETESLYADSFGAEFVSGLQPWLPLKGTQQVMLITTSGYAKLFRSDLVLPGIEQPAPFTLQRMPGDPAALVPADNGTTVYLVTRSGRLAGVSPEAVGPIGRRVMKVAAGEDVIGAITVNGPSHLLLMNDKGRGRCIPVDTLAAALQYTPVQKLLNGPIAAATLVEPSAPLWAITSRRVLPLDLPPESDTPSALLRLRKGETLLGLYRPGLPGRH